MAADKKIPRLGKAAGEFNVGTNSIVLLLKKKGIDIVDSPNTKLTEDMYDVLVKEFNAEKIVKEESQKINIPSFGKKQADETENEKTEVPAEVLPKTEPEVKKQPVQEAEKVVEKIEIQRPKIIGKIELEPKPAKKKAKEPVEIIEKETVKEEVVVEVPVEEVVAPPAIDIEPVQEPAPSPTPEHIKTEPVQGPQLKIIDKIDLSEFDKKKKKTGKSDSAKKKAKEEVVEPKEVTVVEPVAEPVVEPVTAETVTPQVEERKIEHIETKVERLKAPKIMGKIDLPVEKPKEPAKKDHHGDADKKNRKRKRIKSTVPTKPSKDDPKFAKKKPEIKKEEISQEDIDKQIKATMQRLEPLGKSKTSKRRREKRAMIHSEMLEVERQEQEAQKVLQVTEFITANELATLMNIPVNKIIATCMSVGLAVSINQRLDAETISLLTDEFGFEVQFVGVDKEEEKESMFEDAPEDLHPRHPIVTVMGHVDHGKTSLLDYIRKSNVIAGEAGGITQHIGAYEVNLNDGRKITFLDTPGHEAFTAMRARGAKVTDITIIVIAADDAIMPQTVEAISHAQAAGVPMVFAITKIDKPSANPEKIREGLANMNILVEEWGGNYQCQEIDAKHGTNINELLEKVLLEAELLELKANPNRLGVGTVIESSLDKGKGYVAKILVQNGEIKIGDPVTSGSFYGKVRTLFNERNQQIKSAGPATPVLLLGLNGAPQAGEIFKVMPSEHEARLTATKRAQLVREMGLRTQKHITLDEIGRRIAIGDFKELNIIVKGDVDGSVEALADSLLKLSTEQVQVNVIHKSVGAVTEGDVLLASASNAIIVAFQVRPSPGSRKLAEQEQIDIRTYSIIYTAINEIKDAIEGMHTPEIKEKIICNLEIREVFKITKVGNIAGCIVLDGKIQRNTKIHLIRDGIVIHTGKLGSLKRFKDDAKEVFMGQDCGLNIENYNDIKVGDIIEGFEEYEEKPIF
ncbi:translation initiation factor IF-2 [Bacteroidales bacterium OttesenSCG-928-C03]|nr:translation initiation factor IF-2 [Bacteroidales bacterium OttesenSCG-928-E04]MDL2308130.1 translation initiation factor IF-2 [Bacteroidales bacterium OttesenSCG-928-C03]MDL2325556.1 translation initiation factor IF-2 [Bacteroidales bacterium OttesenSCG-928-A14]